MIGTTVGRYRIVEKIGQGGMGEVFLAEDASLKRKVALKFLPEHLQEDDVARRRFLREAESAAALEHPYICNIKEVNRTEAGQVFIVMEYVEGQTLKERLEADGLLPLAEGVRIASEVADALALAHAKGIVHRDLKPANIMLTPQGHAKVMDFGLAKRVIAEDGTEGDPTSDITREGSALGTPAYMSPEQLRTEPVDSRSDLFSLGIVLYEMLTGVHPFLRPSSVATMGAILYEEPEPLAEHLPDSTDLLRGTVSRLLAKDPAQRMQTVEELADRLAEVGAAGEELRLRAFLGSRLGRRLVVGSAAAVAAAVLFGSWWLRGGGSSGGGPLVRSLAVLPLANLSGDPDQEYFSEGLTDELTIALSKIGNLTVVSRSAASRFKDAEMSLGEIAGELGVEALVAGSVLREGDRVRVSAQLVNPSTESNLWAETYERSLTSVMALYGDVAQAIAGEIRVTLTPEEESRLALGQEVEWEVYDAYLKGSYHWKKLTPEDLETAERYFQLALEKDSTFAPAYAGIAWVWSSRATMTIVSSEDAGPRIEAAALKAIELDPDAAEAYEALAMTRTWTDWDWAGAGPAWEQVLAINPNADNAHAFYAHFLAIIGRSGDAVPHSERALALDPLNALFQGLYAQVLCFERRWDEAMAAAATALEMQPRLAPASNALQYAYMAKGMREEQLAFQRERIAQDPERVAAFEQGLAEGGYEGAQRAIAEVLAARYREGRYFSPKGIALRYLDAGDHVRAIDWLETGYEVRQQSMPYIGFNPIWDPLRSDPRFQALLRKMDIPERSVPVTAPDVG
jgi:serine/threonine-protein kinase